MSCKSCEGEIAQLRAENERLQRLGLSVAKGVGKLPPGTLVVLPAEYRHAVAKVAADGTSFEDEIRFLADDDTVTKAIDRSLAQARRVPQTGKWKHYGSPYPALRGKR